MHAQASGNMAHATILASRSVMPVPENRLDIFLRETASGRFRWFYADGKPTVIEGSSPEQAVAVAKLVWSDLVLDAP